MIYNMYYIDQKNSTISNLKINMHILGLYIKHGSLIGCWCQIHVETSNRIATYSTFQWVRTKAYGNLLEGEVIQP